MDCISHKECTDSFQLPSRRNKQVIIIIFDFWRPNLKKVVYSRLAFDKENLFHDLKTLNPCRSDIEKIIRDKHWLYRFKASLFQHLKVCFALFVVLFHVIHPGAVQALVSE